MGRPSLHSQHEQLLPTKVLRGVVMKMHAAFPRLCALWNEESCMRKNWALLFGRLDTDGSGRLDYGEFRQALVDVLEIKVSDKECKGLWGYIDHDKSDIVSIKEFQHGCYLLLLDDWPRLDKPTLARLCDVINEAAVHEYSKEGSGTSSGNWFQIFGHFDTDESGRLGWEELEQVSRRRDPGLNLNEAMITLHELRGLWRAIDLDCSGDVTVDEFMHFMKKHASAQLTQLTEFSKKARGLATSGPKRSSKLDAPEETRQECIKRLAETLNANRKPRKPRKKPDYLVNSKFAKQLAVLQWRKRDTNRKIHSTLQARAAEAERDFVTRFVQPPQLKEEARRQVILDELSRPLAVDVDLFQAYEKTARNSNDVELGEASRHATALKRLESKLRRRELGVLARPGSPTQTFELMRASVNGLREKMSAYAEGRFGAGTRAADWTRPAFALGIDYQARPPGFSTRPSPYA